MLSLAKERGAEVKHLMENKRRPPVGAADRLRCFLCAFNLFNAQIMGTISSGLRPIYAAGRQPAFHDFFTQFECFPISLIAIPMGKSV